MRRLCVWTGGRFVCYQSDLHGNRSTWRQWQLYTQSLGFPWESGSTQQIKGEKSRNVDSHSPSLQSSDHEVSVRIISDMSHLNTWVPLSKAWLFRELMVSSWISAELTEGLNRLLQRRTMLQWNKNITWSQEAWPPDPPLTLPAGPYFPDSQIPTGSNTQSSNNTGRP